MPLPFMWLLRIPRKSGIARCEYVRARWTINVHRSWSLSARWECDAASDTGCVIPAITASFLQQPNSRLEPTLDGMIFRPGNVTSGSVQRPTSYQGDDSGRANATISMSAIQSPATLNKICAQVSRIYAKPHVSLDEQMSSMPAYAATPVLFLLCTIEQAGSSDGDPCFGSAVPSTFAGHEKKSVNHSGPFVRQMRYTRANA
jgi:hypothetical protein